MDDTSMKKDDTSNFEVKKEKEDKWSSLMAKAKDADEQNSAQNQEFLSIALRAVKKVEKVVARKEDELK